MNCLKKIFFLLLIVFVAGVAAQNFTLTDYTTNFNVSLGNWSQQYTLTYAVNVTTPPGHVANAIVTFFMPYGMYNASAVCNATAVAGVTPGGAYGVMFDALTRGTACAIKYNNLTNATISLTVKANVSAFPSYYPYNPQRFYATANCTSVAGTSACTLAQSSPSMRYAVNYWINPRPHAVISNLANVSILFTHWNQTDANYTLSAPLMQFDQTLRRPVPKNTSFADIMFQNGVMMERPSYVRMWSYNLTFRLLFNGTTPQQIVLFSPLNETQTGCTAGGSSDCPPQSIMPLYTRTEQQMDFVDNVSFNMTVGVPRPDGYDVYINGTKYTNTQAQAFGFTAMFMPGFMQNVHGAFVISANSSLNNTEITLLFTVMNQTPSGLQPTSPVYVDWQQISGFTFGPRFGENVSVSYLGRIRNALSNFTLYNLYFSYFIPLNFTYSPAYPGNGSCCNWSANETFTLASNVNMSWNNTAESGWIFTTTGVTNRTSCMVMTDTRPGSPALGLHYPCFIVFTVPLGRDSFNNWNPGSANSNVTLNFTAQLSFPAMAEQANTPASPGTTNTYKVSFSPSMQTNLDLTDKVPGIRQAGCENTEITLNGETLTCGINYTIASLTLLNVGTGNQQLSVTYSIPLGAGGTSVTTVCLPCSADGVCQQCCASDPDCPTATPTATVAATVAPTIRPTAAPTPTPEVIEEASPLPTAEASVPPVATVTEEQRTALVALQEAKALRERAQAQGIYSTEVNSLITRAEQAYAAGNWASAIYFANQAKESLNQKLAAVEKPEAKAGFDWAWVLGFLVLVILVVAYYYSRKPSRKGM